ncbi:MAG: pyridoxal phosphate-dependent aminotransferase [Thermoflexales bacterium]|nr:pyridoxal phosphate-dependent aminotransferase [Thermoflexales bacterium]
MQVAQRTTLFRESVIRRMTRLAIEHEAINLSQGFPDFDTPPALKEAAAKAIMDGQNQYSPTWGIVPLREKLAEMYTRRLGWAVNPAEHVTVTCGVTEAINSAVLATLNPGDEIVIVEPAHENFVPSAIFAGARPVPVMLDLPDYRLDPDRLASVITPRTRAMLLNTPHNPTGRVFDAEEVQGVVDLVLEHDLVLITDEIYDRILYDGRQHVCPGSLEALRDRTITIGGLSKTFAITGWRLGYVITPSRVAVAVRAVHDFLTVCAPTPLQVGAVTALGFPQEYYDAMLADYQQRRAVMMQVLAEVGFAAPVPEGSYYVLADYSRLPAAQAEWDSTRFAEWLVADIGVAVVPGTVFYSLPGYGERSVRFAFPKHLKTLQAAGERLKRLL